MLNFYRINSVTDPFFANLYNLYAIAFAPAERRSWAGLEYELNYEKRFFSQALIQNEKFVGFLNYWTFDRFYYIEHLAVISSMRGKKIGSEAIEILKSQTKLPIVFEVEMPNDPTSILRIQFYEKLGFTVLSHNYAQPPYEGDGFFIPMQLMTNDVHFATTHFELIKETLYNKVYHYELESEREEI
ncbi:MAG: GNAT family N-acetyltransferase [Paludibacter sp.]|nr:GNAT family N-acetyltransferase [Paludibacter sp.]